MEKKFWGFLFFLSVIVSASAQDTIMFDNHIFERSYPVDTVGFGYPSYLFNPISANLIVFNHPSVNNNPAHTNASILPHGMLQKYPTLGDNTLIYGIATTVIRNAQEYHTGPNPRFVIARRESNGDFVVTDSLTLDSYRVDKMYDYYGVDPNDGVWYHSYKYLYEYYFDQPIVMPHADNFFVGSMMDSMGNIGSRPEVQTRLTCGMLPQGTAMESDCFWAMRSVAPYDWVDLSSFEGVRMWGVFFPIIRPDSLICGKVVNFRMEEWETDHVKLAWGTTRPFRDLHTGHFQIALGGLGPRPDTTNILTFSDTTAVLQGLDSGVWYSTWVRAECCHCGCPMHGDTLIWGPWRGPVQFYLGSRQPGTEGIESVENQGLKFSLSPNPAKGTVTVEMGETQRDASLQTIQVVDMEGRVVLTQPWEGAAAQPLTLDISGLAAGVYLVRINTPMSTATRKLMVE